MQRRTSGGLPASAGGRNDNWREGEEFRRNRRSTLPSSAGPPLLDLASEDLRSASACRFSASLQEAVYARSEAACKYCCGFHEHSIQA